MALVVLLAVLALAPRCTHADPISDRACSKPGLTAFPFCNVSLPRAARIADLVSRLADAEKPGLLTARGWPQGNVQNISRLGVPAFDWVCGWWWWCWWWWWWWCWRRWRDIWAWGGGRRRSRG